MTKYVVISKSGDDWNAWCHGVFDDGRTAIGCAMQHIWEFKESYKSEGDSFEYTEPEYMDGNGGYCITVKFKSHFWDEGCEELWYILHSTEPNIIQGHIE